MDLLQKGWFTEFSPDDLEKIKNTSSGDSKQLKSDGVEMGGAWPGQAFSLQIEEVLFHEKSKYQDVLVFKSKTYGNVLILDGIIQCTERDEFAYQEMLAHLPLFAHPNPKRVLIIGGGDGGILREVLKHSSVEHVTMCEIDEMVIEVSKKYLPGMAEQFGNPKLNLFIGDGFEFLKNHKNEFDVVITDSSDPVGPAESLFGKSYYQLLSESMKDGGILSSQGECPWIDLKLVEQLNKICGDIFVQIKYAIGSVPTYTTGLMGYLICTNLHKEVNHYCYCSDCASFFWCGGDFAQLTSESVWLHLKIISHMIEFTKQIFPTVRYASSIMSTYPSGTMGYLIASKDNRDVTKPARTLTSEEIKSMKLKFYNSELHSAAFILPTFVNQALHGSK